MLALLRGRRRADAGAKTAAQKGLLVWLGHDDKCLESPAAQWAQLLYWAWPTQALLKAAAIGLMLLAAWDGLYSCTPRASFADECAISHAKRAVQAAETLTLIILMMGFGLQARYKGARLVLADKWLFCVGLALMMCGVTLFVHVVTLSKLKPEEGEQVLVAHISWVFRALLRPVPFLHFFPPVRRTLVVLVALIPRVAAVFFVVIMVIAVFALFGRVLVLDDMVPGNDYGLEGNGFDSLYESVVTTFWWAFGGNGPAPGDQVGRPGYKAGEFWALYWVVYTILQTFYLIQVVTAVVYDEYGSMVSVDERRQEQFAAARARELIEALRKGRPTPLREDIDALNEDMAVFRFGGFHPFEIAETEAADPAAIVRMIVHNRKRVRERYAAAPIRAIHWAMEGRITAVLFRVAAALNAALLLGTHESASETESNLVSSNFLAADLALLVVTLAYLADLALALLVYVTPPRPYPLWQSPVLMRYTLTAVAVVVTLIHAGFRDEVRLRSVHMEFHSLLLLQVLDAIRVVPSVDLTFRIMAQVAPAMANLVLALLCAMYSWSVIGVSIHRARILTSSEVLINDADGALYTMNFNNVFGGIYTLFMGLYGNNIQQFTAQYYLVSGWPGLLHFFIFYLWGTLIAANVVVSVLIDVHQEIRRERLPAPISATAVVPLPGGTSEEAERKGREGHAPAAAQGHHLALEDVDLTD